MRQLSPVTRMSTQTWTWHTTANGLTTTSIPSYRPTGIVRMLELSTERTRLSLVELVSARGKSGLHRTRWWVTPTGRKTRESATESKPPQGKGETVR